MNPYLTLSIILISSALFAQSSDIPEFTVCTDSRQIHVHAEEATVQWVNCDTREEIPGADSDNFLPLKNGYYSAIVTVGDRAYQTSCIEVNGWPAEMTKGEPVELHTRVEAVEWIMNQSDDEVHIFNEDGVWIDTYYSGFATDSELSSGRYKVAIHTVTDQWMIRDLIVSYED